MSAETTSNPFMDRFQQEQNGSSSSSGGRKYDLLATVKSVNPGAGTVTVTLKDTSKAVKDGYPSEFDVGISKYAPAPNRPDADFEGNVIDKRMAEYFQAGDGIILEGVTLNSGAGPFPVNWLSSVPGRNPEKLIEGNFTASGFSINGVFQVRSVQQWSSRALTPEEFFASDEILDLYRESAENHAKNTVARAARERGEEGEFAPLKPLPGVAFRAVVNGEVVSIVPSMAYNQATERPITLDEVKAGVEAWTVHIKEIYPTARVEIVPVREYTVGHDARTPLGRGAVGSMARVVGKVSPDAELGRFGNNVQGVHGLLLLSAGKLMPRGTRRGEQNDWVVNMLASSRKFPIHNAVLGSDGNPVALNEVMAEFGYPSKKAPSSSAAPKDETSTAPATAEKAASETSAASVPAAPSADNASDDIESQLDAAFAGRGAAVSSPAPK